MACSDLCSDAEWSSTFPFTDYNKHMKPLSLIYSCRESVKLKTILLGHKKLIK